MPPDVPYDPDNAKTLGPGETPAGEKTPRKPPGRPPIPETLSPAEGETLLAHAPRDPDGGATIVREGSATDAPAEAGGTRRPASASVAALLKARERLKGIAGRGGPEPGDRIAGPSGAARYSTAGEIARGGMGAILKILDNDIGRPVAMKVILEGDDPERVERFVEEAQITGQLEHPNIVPVHEIGLTPDGRVYFTMKLVKGRSLESIVRGISSKEPEVLANYSLPALLRVFLKVCDAVSFAHSRGVLHRDLKPENVMVGEFGEVQVMDWGLAKVTVRADSPDAASRHPDSPDAAARQADLPDRKGGGASAASGPGTPGARAEARTREGRDTVRTIRSHEDGLQTLDGEIMGTPSYMSPEQADGRLAEVDERSDVFALGGILYTLLVHEPLYTGVTTMNLVTKASKAEFEPPRKRAPDLRVPPELESVCLKALAREKAGRYGSVAEMAADVQAFLEHRLVRAHAYGPAARTLRFLQRHPAASLAAAVALILASLGGGAVGVFAARARAEEAQRREAEARAANEGLRARDAERDRALAQVRAESAEKDRALAQQRADDAKAALVKGRQVSAVMRAAFGDLAPVAAELKRIRNSFAKAEDMRSDADKTRPAIEAFAASVPSDPVSQSTWLAIRGWLTWLALDRDAARECFRRSRELDPDNACAPLFRAMLMFAEYIRIQPYPAYSITAQGLRFHWVPGESGDMREIRESLEKALEEARAAKVWGETSSQDFQEALGGFQAMQGGRDLALAETSLTKALMVPEMAWIRPELLFARAKVRLLLYKFDPAIADLEAVAAAGCMGAEPVYFKAKALSCRGYEERVRGADPRESFRRSIEGFTAAEAMAPGVINAMNNRGQAWQSIAIEQARRGEDPTDAFRNAIADFDENLRRGDTSWAADYNTAVAHNSRGTAFLDWAEYRASKGEDVEALYRDAIRDFLAGIQSKFNYASPHANLERAIAAMARHLALRGRSMQAVVEAWIDEAGKRAEADPKAWLPLYERGYFLELTGALEDAERVYAGLEARGLRADFVAQTLQRVRDRMAQPPWMRDLARAEQAIQWGDIRLSREAYQRGLEGADAAGAHADPKSQDLLIGARYNLACCLSLLSAGIVQAGAKPQPVDETEARQLRNAAVAQLGRSLELGWKDLEHIGKDTDLDPLRADRRFQALIEEWKKRLESAGGEGEKK